MGKNNSTQIFRQTFFEEHRFLKFLLSRLFATLFCSLVVVIFTVFQFQAQNVRFGL